jgi:hypothetical protein
MSTSCLHIIVEIISNEHVVGNSEALRTAQSENALLETALRLPYMAVERARVCYGRRSSSQTSNLTKVRTGAII